jgi:rRNA biogenesis protein RRP5
LTRADKKRLKAQREAEIAAAERARLAGPGAGPESAAEYEQQLLAQPNNSYLWIKYMAFQIKLGGWRVSEGGGGEKVFSGQVVCRVSSTTCF